MLRWPTIYVKPVFSCIRCRGTGGYHGPPGLVLGYASHPPDRLREAAATIAGSRESDAVVVAERR